uniref:Uncharacterized protein n=1 Tax=Haptolina brevifila TaxID=156173 RepID=A0A7S2NGS1_9EUKA|mmetsp:Transcript_77322/g.153503  ORF Transcript_77322/g.153503 Transcript_77322/m.153503 type:complete len:580 (+) Transcript_77322:84-1823(+)
MKPARSAGGKAAPARSTGGKPALRGAASAGTGGSYSDHNKSWLKEVKKHDLFEEENDDDASEEDDEGEEDDDGEEGEEGEEAEEGEEDLEEDEGEDEDEGEEDEDSEDDDEEDDEDEEMDFERKARETMDRLTREAAENQEELQQQIASESVLPTEEEMEEEDGAGTVEISSAGIQTVGKDGKLEKHENYKEAVEALPAEKQGKELLILNAYKEVESGNIKTSTLNRLNQEVEKTPKDARVRAILGQGLAQSGKVEEGIEQLERAVQLAPDNPGFNQMLAAVVGAVAEHGPRDAAKWEAMAIKRYKAGLKLTPEDPQSYVGLGAIYARLSKLETEEREGGSKDNRTLATEAFNTAIELDPNNTKAYAELAELLVHHDATMTKVPNGHVLGGAAVKAMKQAKKLAKIAIGLSPKTADGYMALAAAVVGAPDRLCKMPMEMGVVSGCIGHTEKAEAISLLLTPIERQTKNQEIEANRTKAKKTTGKTGKKLKKQVPVWSSTRQAATNFRRLGYMYYLDDNPTEAEKQFGQANQLAEPSRLDPDHDWKWLSDLRFAASAAQDKKERGGQMGGMPGAFGMGGS